MEGLWADEYDNEDQFHDEDPARRYYDDDRNARSQAQKYLEQAKKNKRPKTYPVFYDHDDDKENYCNSRHVSSKRLVEAGTSQAVYSSSALIPRYEEEEEAPAFHHASSASSSDRYMQDALIVKSEHAMEHYNTPFSDVALITSSRRPKTSRQGGPPTKSSRWRQGLYVKYSYNRWCNRYCIGISVFLGFWLFVVPMIAVLVKNSKQDNECALGHAQIQEPQLELTLAGFTTKVSDAEQFDLARAVVEGFNSVSKGCEDEFQRWMADAMLLDQVMVHFPSEQQAANGKMYRTALVVTFGTKISCKDCSEGKAFASIYPSAYGHGNARGGRRRRSLHTGTKIWDKRSDDDTLGDRQSVSGIYKYEPPSSSEMSWSPYDVESRYSYYTRYAISDHRELGQTDNKLNAADIIMAIQSNIASKNLDFNFAGISSVSVLATSNSVALSMYAIVGTACADPSVVAKSAKSGGSGGKGSGKGSKSDAGSKGTKAPGSKGSKSSAPSCTLTSIPSALPTTSTPLPSSVPTIPVPSVVPSVPPSLSPSVSTLPSVLPSESPSDKPSEVPSESPSVLPSESPSDKPSTKPSQFPSDKPSDKPSEKPSSMPSLDCGELTQPCCLDKGLIPFDSDGYTDAGGNVFKADGAGDGCQDTTTIRGVATPMVCRYINQICRQCGFRENRVCCPIRDGGFEYISATDDVDNDGCRNTDVDTGVALVCDRNGNVPRCVRL